MHIMHKDRQWMVVNQQCIVKMTTVSLFGIWSKHFSICYHTDNNGLQKIKWYFQRYIVWYVHPFTPHPWICIYMYNAVLATSTIFTPQKSLSQVMLSLAIILNGKSAVDEWLAVYHNVGYDTHCWGSTVQEWVRWSVCQPWECRWCWPVWGRWLHCQMSWLACIYQHTCYCRPVTIVQNLV